MGCHASLFSSFLLNPSVTLQLCIKVRGPHGRHPALAYKSSWVVRTPPRHVAEYRARCKWIYSSCGIDAVSDVYSSSMLGAKLPCWATTRLEKQTRLGQRPHVEPLAMGISVTWALFSATATSILIFQGRAVLELLGYAKFSGVKDVRSGLDQPPLAPWSLRAEDIHRWYTVIHHLSERSVLVRWGW